MGLKIHEPTCAFRVRVHDNSDDTAYFELRDHPPENSRGCVCNTIALHLLLGDDYAGPALNLDFDHQGSPIGIEVLYPSTEGDD